MKKLFSIILATTALTSSIWAQTEAKIVEVNSNQVKIQYDNGTEQTFVAAPATTPVAPAPKVDNNKNKMPLGFQFNADLAGNLAFIGGFTATCGGKTYRVGNYAVGGLDFTVGAGVRAAKFLYVGVASGFLGEWGNTKVETNGEPSSDKASASAYTVPIYADARVYAPNGSSCFPYIEVGIGGYVGIDGNVKWDNESFSNKPDGGFYFISGAGLEFKRLNIGAGYKLMRNSNVIGNHGYVKVGISLGRPSKLRQ